MIRAIISIVVGIHAGDSTHHQDQSMTWHSFKTIKAIRSKPVRPTPPDAVVLLSLINIICIYSSARGAGLEPATGGFGDHCSIQLSYPSIVFSHSYIYRINN